MNSAAWSWNDTFALILTGISVVFLALVLLIFVITIMGKISTSLLNKQTTAVASSPAPQPVPKTPPAKAVPAPAMVVESGIEEEVVAVISAAVAAMATEENTYQITGIQKSRALPRASSSRNAWALAGQLENTQPF